MRRRGTTFSKRGVLRHHLANSRACELGWGVDASEDGNPIYLGSWGRELVGARDGCEITPGVGATAILS